MRVIITCRALLGLFGPLALFDLATLSRRDPWRYQCWTNRTLCRFAS